MGVRYLVLALVARLPFTMMVVGSLTLLVERGETVAAAGAVSAVAGIGTALGAPILGRLVERFGQRVVLLVAALIFAAAVLSFLILVFVSAPLWAVAAVAALAGLASPQVAPMSRARVAVTARRHAPSGDLVDRAMGYESMADEGAFVLGPVLVGAASVLLGSFAPLLVAVGLTLTAVLGFALHRSSALRSDAGPQGRESTRYVTPRFIMLFSGMLLVGAIFGATLTSLTATLERERLAEWTGLIYGLMSVGSIISAALISRIPQRVLSRRLRWVMTALLALVGLCLLAFGSGMAMLVAGLSVLGLGIGACLVSIFSYATDAVPAARHTSAFAVLASALIVSQAVTTAGIGQLVTGAGPQAGFLGGAVLGGLLVVVALAERVVSVKRR